MKTYILISAVIFAALAVRSAVRLLAVTKNVDDLVALVLLASMMTWGVILL